jgi:hypothetical protein
MTRTNSLDNEVISHHKIHPASPPRHVDRRQGLAIETTYGEIGTTDRLDPRRGIASILVRHPLQRQKGIKT